MIAELSQEEVASIQQLVNKHYGVMDMPRIQQLIRDTHPLCAEHDLQNAIAECINKLKGVRDNVKSEPIGYRPTASFQIPPPKPQYQPQQVYQEPYKIPLPPSYPPPANSVMNQGVVVFSKDQPISHKVFSTEDPAYILASRWTDEETDKLKEYLDMTQGRKDWTKCARHVGTKSNAQCKAKYNNMRASERARDVFAL
ncbi:hypothetical protein EV175_004196 [Coemansia sp. RSA 1933]|nr:hypothetical protein EV175_004196 [Coemansia sp. RSA 1933]